MSQPQPFASPLVDPAALDEWEAFVAQVLHRPRLEASQPQSLPPRRRPQLETTRVRVWPAYLLYLGCGLLALTAIGLLVAPDGVRAIGADPFGTLGAIGEFLGILLRGTTGTL